jgi:hypothetical protein
MTNPRFRPAFLLGAISLVAAPLHAGLWDDVKEGVQSAREIVDDVGSTRGEAKKAVGDAKEMAEETSDDIGSALPEQEAKSGAPPPPSASAPPPPSARQWQIDIGGGQTRTVAENDLAQMIRSGEVGRDTFVWSDALGSWTAAGKVSALAPYFPK